MAGASPFVWGGAGGAENAAEEDVVEGVDDVEDMEEVESLRWGTFRGWNMRETSSALIAFSPPCPSMLFHRGRC